MTGASGLIGSRVVRALLAQGREVRAMKRASSDLRNLEGLDLELADGDLLDPGSLDRALKGCDSLFQVAAIYRHWHPRGGEFIRKTNIEGTRNILEAALKRDLEKLVYTSSISSVGFKPGRLSTEDDFPDLKDCRRQPYRESKFISEKMAFEYAERLPIVIVNPASPIGVGDWAPTPTGRVILDFLNGKMIAFVDVGLNLIDVDDLAQGYLLAEERGRVGERYILGNHNTRLREFLQMIADMTGLPAPRVKVPKALLRVVAEVNEFVSDITKREPVAAVEQALHTRYNEFVDCTKARTELGLAQNDIRIAIHKAVRYYLDTGDVKPGRKSMIELKGPDTTT